MILTDSGLNKPGKVARNQIQVRVRGNGKLSSGRKKKSIDPGNPS